MDFDKLKRCGIDYALWEITANCNFSCLHCRASATPDSPRSDAIVGDKALRLIKSLSNLNTKTLVFTGGEPLLRNDVEDLVSFATSLGIRCRIQSNGSLLDEQRLRKLRDAGLFSFGIGLDSPYAKHHDKIRNRTGSYSEAICAIGLIKKNNMACHVETTLTKDNLGHLGELLTLVDSLNVDTLLLRAALPSGRASATSESLVLSKHEYKDAMINIGLLSKKYPNLLVNSQDPLYCISDPELLERILAISKANKKKVISGCTMGLNTLHIRSTGLVGACTFISDITIGDLNHQSLEEIWDTRFNNTILADCISRNLKGKCKICKNRFICGGCRARALGFNDDIYANDPYCWL